MNDQSTHSDSCPFPHGTAGGAAGSQGTTSKDWWPNQLDLSPLLANNPDSSPYQGQGFNYLETVKNLDIPAVKEAIIAVMHDSQSWWPADYGHYGPFFIRLAWHSAGTYRVGDGRGGGGQGLQRFSPLNSWPDNVNLDKARRLLWPVKKQFGQMLSWADLMLLAGNVALEDMGFEPFGFAFGRTDVWEPDNTYWGNETEWLANERYAESREADTLDHPLAAVQMGLIYVNPEGPDGNATDFVGSAGDIRETFKRMAMNDEETVALIAGGHAFGKTHGAGDASQVGVAPEGNVYIEDAGIGWKNSQGKGHSEDTISSGLEVTWTPNPTKWDNDYLKAIYAYDNWEIEDSPAGAKQWRPVADEVPLAPHAHLENEYIEIRMLTTDLALRFGDPEYDRICRKFLEDFDYFSDVFARAWFKLTHRDMGPKSNYFGPDVPAEKLLWQDPIRRAKDTPPEDFLVLAEALDKSDLTDTDLIKTAWASASSYRKTDKRGGANGARIALEPMRSWPVNDPAHLAVVLSKLEAIRVETDIDVSLADLIVFGGSHAIAKATGREVDDNTFVPGRGDATQDQTDVESFNHLYAMADGFRNWGHKPTAENAEKFLIEKAALLGLTPPAMTALIGGLRVLGVTNYGSTHGVLTENVGTLSTDYFVNLLDMNIEWRGIDGHLFEGVDRETGEARWTATRADLVFSSNSVLRALAEVYASDDGKEIFMDTFTYAWHKVMNADLK
jgi:catalase-peroxidase|tara:strand:+ start:1336 stop:3519 length:2184 start_codon:yes stop_codon:yes gene_type:complete